MLERLETLVNAQADFAFETTLAARNFAQFITVTIFLRILFAVTTNVEEET
jgi:predicted ABC-type ATPase